MSILSLAMLLSIAAPAQNTIPNGGIAIAERLVAAIKGDAEFQDQDFAKPLNNKDKAALRTFAACKVARIANAGFPQSGGRDVFVPNPNDVVVRLDCEGVPPSTPVGISLYLENGKVAKIETHNADLMRLDR